MAKIAMELDRAWARPESHGVPGKMTATELARGEGWEVSDVICTSGAQDRPYEEQHTRVSVAIVTAGSFEYRPARGATLLTPGALMLGNAGEYFECGHDHSRGDRCISFHFSPDYFERIAADAGASTAEGKFGMPRVPAARETAALVALACIQLSDSTKAAWEEIGVRLAARALQLAGGATAKRTGFAPAAVARVSRAVRMIEHEASDKLTLGNLAREAGLSPYHFLRVFESLTGATPHQYVLRMRLRRAAVRVATESANIADIALESGFGDVSNFNHAFLTEFGRSPRAYRQRSRVSCLKQTASVRTNLTDEIPRAGNQGWGAGTEGFDWKDGKDGTSD